MSRVHSTSAGAAQAGLYYHFYGVPKHPLSKKMFGIFRAEIRSTPRCLSSVASTTVFSHAAEPPYRGATRGHSRECRGLTLIAESPESGVSIVMARGGTGVLCHRAIWSTLPTHSTRNTSRDLGKRDDVDLPKNYYYHDDPDRSSRLVTWRAHANLLSTATGSTITFTRRHLIILMTSSKRESEEAKLHILAKSMRTLELLAPAKNLECGIAAIDHGADAVYIGALSALVPVRLRVTRSQDIKSAVRLRPSVSCQGACHGQHHQSTILKIRTTPCRLIEAVAGCRCRCPAVAGHGCALCPSGRGPSVDRGRVDRVPAFHALQCDTRTADEGEVAWLQSLGFRSRQYWLASSRSVR
jgi:hypothetical protein